MGRKSDNHRPLSHDRAEISARKERQTRDAKTRREIKRHKNYRLGVLGALPGWIRQVLQFALVIVLILSVDGIRRESAEFRAHVFARSGSVQILKGDDVGWSPVVEKSSLADGDSIITGQQSYSVLTFPDGSAIQLAPNTRVTIKQLEYSRNGARTRAFMLDYGSVVARMSGYFGQNSTLVFCTPAASAFVNSTGVGVNYNQSTGRGSFVAYGGYVDVQRGASVVRCQNAEMAETNGRQISRAVRASTSTLANIQDQMARLQLHEKELGTLMETEYKLNATCDPVLQILGFTAGGWNYTHVDFFRKSDCREALTKLQAAMESSHGMGVPSYLNLATLAELRMSQKETNDILNKFYAHMLLNYVSSSPGQYSIMVRARDKNKTMYELTESGIYEMKNR